MIFAALQRHCLGAKALLRSIRPSVYVLPCAEVGGASVAQHVRHTFDHFARVANGAQRFDEDGVWRYDARARGTGVETELNVAIAAAVDLSVMFRSLAERSDAADGWARRRVRVSFDMPHDDSGAREEVFESTIEREAMFALHHAFHHDAMISVIAQAHPEWNIALPDGFGVAPSTKSFLANNGEGG